MTFTGIFDQLYVFCCQTHPEETQRGDPKLCEWLRLQARASPGGEHGPEAVGPSGLPAAPEPPPGPDGGAETGHGSRRADCTSCVAQGHVPRVRSLPPLARYEHSTQLLVFFSGTAGYLCGLTDKKALMEF